ncbi:energy transducer TonB [Phenylobacterium sp.]|uniref:energy transducer TonB family protein n=1 Tax=Phenylobacterium sp. TaxID=1871053 RepID=UPI00271F089D|nr:energy transducer TonB [Phenylobacterium sp.]MDO8380221.1 energy transducer TonB [Phenylobacterium sp.]
MKRPSVDQAAAIGASIVLHAAAAWGLASLRPMAELAPQQAMLVELVAAPQPAPPEPDGAMTPATHGPRAVGPPLHRAEPMAARPTTPAAMAATAAFSPPAVRPAGAPETVAKVAALSAEDQLTDYRRRLWAHLAAHAPAAPSGSGTVSVAFGLDESGTLLFVRLARSSGRPAFDRACLASVRAAAPLPAPPEGIAQADLMFTVPIKAAPLAQGSHVVVP